MLGIWTLHSIGAERWAVNQSSVIQTLLRTTRIRVTSSLRTSEGNIQQDFPLFRNWVKNTLCWLARKWWRTCLIPHKKQSSPSSSSLQQRQDFNTSSTTQKCGLIPKHTRTAGPRLEGGINLTRMGYFLLDPRRSRTVRQCQSSLSTPLSAIAVGELDEWPPL